MGRGRGKGRQLNQEDCGSGEEEEIKVPVQKKRGRPLKHLKEHVQKMNEGDRNNASFVQHKNQSDDVLKKRKIKYESKVKDEVQQSEVVKEESGDETKSSSVEEECVKTSGFRQNSRRRKNKPRRAAEAVVECC